MIKSWIAWSRLSLLSTWQMYSFLNILSDFCLPLHDLNLYLLTYALLLNLDFLHMRNFRCWIFSFASQNSMTYIFGSLHQRLRHEHDIIFLVSAYAWINASKSLFFSFMICLDEHAYISHWYSVYMLRWTLLRQCATFSWTLR